MVILKRGILLAIEGIDGSGKSLLANNLYKRLTEKLLPVVLTKEPGGSALGKHLRTLLQEQHVTISPKTEYLLFAADRAQHFKEVIIPSLNEKKLIISDRLADSSIVYQGYGRGLDIEMIKTINHWAMSSIEPDLTLYVTIDPETAHDRINKRGAQRTVFEQEHLSFFKKLIHGFDTLYTNKKNIITLDGHQTPENLAHTTTERIIQWITSNNLI